MSTSDHEKVEVVKTEQQAPTYASLVNDPKRRPWYTQKRRILLNLYIMMLLLSNFADGYDGSMMIVNLLPQTACNPYRNGKRPLTPLEALALLAIIQRVGGLAALPFVPYLADGMGRRVAIFTGATIMVVGAILQAASHNVGTFIGARFMIGCGSAFATNSAPMLITEIAYPTQRAALTSSFSALWQGGAVLAAWTTFGSFRIPNSWAWRIPSAVQAAAPFIQILFVFLGPESPRWLVSKGREEEALKTLAYYHAQGDVHDPLVQYEYRQIQTSIKQDSSVGWKDLISTPGNRRRMMVIVALAFFSQWSGNGLVAYYLNPVFQTIGITDPFTQLLVNALLSTENVLMAVGAACLVDKIGRRKLFITSTAGMLVTFTLQTIFSSLYAQDGAKSQAHAVVAFIFLFYAAYDIAYSPLVGAYTVEIMPYALRAKGITVYYFAISVSFIFNQYANPIALERIAWKYYIVFCVWLAFELIFVIRYVVETKGRTLEETAAIFDGKDKLAFIQKVTVTPDTTYTTYTYQSREIDV
ncbi:hypothetical protein M422DRAFT_240639 [Sphaerobolus stellatus SS14]|nr:hypothetical protein M422DRAFT_240639 [Sphaerobolus stellatus SS14]